MSCCTSIAVLSDGLPTAAITLGEATNTIRTALALIESARTGRDVELA